MLTRKPSYRELWRDQEYTLLDIWNGGTKLDDAALFCLWHHYPVSMPQAEVALQEYNDRFGTRYTLDQVDIPMMEALLTE
jgi:hypothetical protein